MTKLSRPVFLRNERLVASPDRGPVARQAKSKKQRAFSPVRAPVEGSWTTNKKLRRKFSLPTGVPYGNEGKSRGKGLAERLHLLAILEYPCWLVRPLMLAGEGWSNPYMRSGDGWCCWSAPPMAPASREKLAGKFYTCLLYTSPSPRDRQKSRMPSSA